MAFDTLTASQALTPGHNYTWTAEGIGANGQAIVADSNVPFTVAPLGVPAPTSPSGPTATDLPTFTWNTLTDATHLAAADFTIKITDTATHTVLTVPNLSGTSYALTTPQALTPGHSYTWTVTGTSSNSKATVSSSSVAFTVEPMAAVALNSPTGSVNTDMPTFAWTPLANADYTAPNRYTITVTDKNSGQVLTIPNVTGTNYTLTTAQALTPGHRFTWSVTAISTNGRSTVASLVGSFSVAALTAPVPVSVSGTIPPTFTWQSVTDANHYELMIEDTATGQVVLSVQPVAGTSYTLTAKQSQSLKTGHRYTWLVAAVSTNGKDTVWSTKQQFTAP